MGIGSSLQQGEIPLSISSIQEKNKKAEAIKVLTQKGIEPNNYELNTMLSEYFDNKPLGMPVYSPIQQEAYEQSSKDDYNHNFSTLNDDLNTLFEADAETNNKAVAVQEYYDREKNKVFNTIAELSLKVDNVLEALKTASYIKQYTESFRDMYGIEFYGNAERNIPVTTAFIDLLQKAVYTDKTKGQVNKLSVPDAVLTPNIVSSFHKIQYQGKPEYAMSDIITDVYMIHGSSDTNEEKTIELFVDLGKDMKFNTVLFRFVSARNMKCTLYLSADGENYTPVYDISANSLAEWNFSPQEMRYLKIACIRNESDGLTTDQDDTSFYEYYYIIKNISVAYEKYQSKSLFVSKLIDFDNLTSVIRLDAEDLIFNNTRIDYFIGFDNGNDKIGWDGIENHKDHELFMFQKAHKIANVHLPEYGAIDGVIEAYSIFELPVNCNRNSIKVIPGYNMWSVNRYEHKDGIVADFSLWKNDFSEYISECQLTRMFMDCENYDGFTITDNSLYVFTQYINLESTQSMFNSFIKIMDIDMKHQYDSAQIRMFVNGYEITTGDDNLYSMSLKKGANKVQIVIYCPSSTYNDRRLYHNLNFKRLTNDVFALPAMKYTSNTVMDRVLDENYEYYTIKDNKIYVKCNPYRLSYNSLEDMGYFITYAALRPDMAGYFKDNHLKFRIMAILNSDDDNLSPRLLNFRLTGR